MSENQTTAPIQVFDTSIDAINLALREIQTALDERAGLRGRVMTYDRIRADAAVEPEDVVTLGTMTTLEDQAFVVAVASTTLTADRLLSGEATVITITDAGANSTITVSVTANGVTFAKIQQIATDRLVGRDTAGTGNLEQLTVGNALEFTGAGGIGVANNGISDARLRDSVAVSVIGRSANSSGDPADIAASANDQALMRQADALSWATPTAGTHSIWIPAQALVPATTDGATSSHLELSGSKNNYMTLDFADTGGKLYAHFQVAFPKKWNEGTVRYVVYWTKNGTSGNTAVFGLQAVAVSHDDLLDVAYGSAELVASAGLATPYDLHISGSSGSMAIAGTPADADLIDFRFYRDSGDASDTLAGVTVQLVGLKMFYVTDASTDG